MNKRYIIKILLVLIISTWHIFLNAQDPNFHIYLCFGQSNMSGNGEIEAQDLIISNRFMVLRGATCNSNGYNYTYGEWETALSPLNRCDTKLTFVDNFGKTMINNLPDNIKIGVGIVAVGGSKIELFDKHNYADYVATAPNWMLNQINLFGGNPYARLVEMGQKAQEVGVIKGILFHQGESNSGEATWPGKVKDVYDNLITDLGLDPAQTPFLVGELVTSAEGGACGGHNSVIAQIPATIPNSYVISAAGLPHNGDRLHFTSAACRTFGERYAMKMLELLPVVDPNFPHVTITTPIIETEYTALATIQISATASDPNGNISNVAFFNGSTKLGEVALAPFTYSWLDVEAGVYSIYAVATDNDGNQTTSEAVTIRVNEPQGPYGGTPNPIPGTIQFEHFDVGGNGFAYLDKTAGNTGGADFRMDEDVDIEDCSDEGNGYNLGWTAAGEWLEYTVNVETAGVYTLTFRVACNGENRTVSLSSDGNIIANNIAIPNTGGWQTWQDVVVPDLELPEGEQILRLTIGDVDYVNLNYVSFLLIEDIVPSVIELKAGWNIIGCPIPGSTSIEQALNSIWEYVEIVKNDEYFFDTSQPVFINVLTELKWGQGYFLKVNSDCNLIFGL
jgi:hypothetical protein